MALRLQATRLEVSSPQFGSAVLQADWLVAISLVVQSPTFSATDPRVLHVVEREISSEFNHPIQISLFTNYNDEHELAVAPKNLVGNTRDVRGPAQHVQVVEPLMLGDQVLYIDIVALLAAVMATIGDLQSQADALQDQVDALNQQLIEQRWIG